ncbi:MAG: (deoxy)nucleoside triphosphate pyrophosphohydrolase [Planctomycetota bacterium]
MTYLSAEAAAAARGQKSKIPTSPAATTVRVGVGVVRRGESGSRQVLVTRRRADQPLGGLWEFPGGKLEPGESVEAAVVRELAEEVGLAVRPVGSLSPIEHVYSHATVLLEPRWCEVIDGEARPLEVAEVAWLAPADLDAERFPPANRALIAEVRAAMGV